MASGYPAPDREVTEVQRDAVSPRRLSHFHNPDQHSHYCDQPDRLKVTSKYACRFARMFVEFARRANRCCFARPRVWEDEGNVVDALVLVVHKQRFGDGSPLILYNPWPCR